MHDYECSIGIYESSHQREHCIEKKRGKVRIFPWKAVSILQNLPTLASSNVNETTGRGPEVPPYAKQKCPSAPGASLGFPRLPQGRDIPWGWV